LQSDYLLVSAEVVSLALMRCYPEAWAEAAGLGNSSRDVLAGFDAMSLMDLPPERYTRLRRLGMTHSLIWEAFCCRPFDVEPVVAFDRYEADWRLLVAAQSQVVRLSPPAGAVAGDRLRDAQAEFLEAVAWIHAPWADRVSVLDQMLESLSDLVLSEIGCVR